jgi:2'-5' RNA ligase
MRSFIAMEARTLKVEETLPKVSDLGAAIRPVKPEGLHITLKFLGEIQETRVDAIYAAMEAAFSPFEPFEISLKGVGAFPSPRRPRVMWVGVEEGRETLIEMQAALEAQLSKLGFQKEKRRFHPHLTLARVKSSRGTGRVRQFIEAHEADPLGRVPVTEVKLKRSVLTPEGAVYSTIKSWSL